MFALDSDPEVHRYLGDKPINTKSEAIKIIEMLLEQYDKFGIARWAIISKYSEEFIGWSGLKFIDKMTNSHINYYDIGYRIRQNFWGHGYAYESANAWINYAKAIIDADALYAITHMDNLQSQNVLRKCNFSQKNTFQEIIHNKPINCIWHELIL